MHFSPTHQLVGLVLALAPVAISSPLAERNYCSNDALLKSFYGQWHSAEAFCCDYIHVPQTTVTIHTHPVKTVTRIDTTTYTRISHHDTTKTKSTTKTKTQEKTVTQTSSITNYATSTTTSLFTTTSIALTTTTDEIDSTITSDLTSTTSTITTSEIDSTITSDLTSTTSTTTTTVTSTTTGLPINGRDLNGRALNPWKIQHPPPCPTSKYGAAQLSSACSCLHLTNTVTKLVTDKPSTYTKVIHTTKVLTLTAQQTETKTKTFSTTITKTDTTTTDKTSTSKSILTLQSTDLESSTTTSATSFTSLITTSVLASTETDVSTTLSTSLTTTSTVVSTETDTSTTLFTSLTTTSTIVSTTITTATTTTTTSVICTPSTYADTNGLQYNQYFSGTGVTENPVNPGNNAIGSFDPILTTYPGSYTACDAAQACTNMAGFDPDVYYSFDLHFRLSTAEWECVQYFNPNTDPGYFDVPDPDVGDAYGYSI